MRPLLKCIFSCMLLLLCSTQAHTASFRWIGEDNWDYGSYATHAYDVSDDGSVVVGQAGSRMADLGAAVWTRGQSLFSCDWPPLEASRADAVSADGNVVVGTEWVQVFRCSQNDGFEFIVSMGTPIDVSADGTSVVGYDDWVTAAFLWTKNNGLVHLGYLSGDDYSVASGISADGSVVVGSSRLGYNGEP
jgi:uncharacterized membrane protein